MTPMRMKMKKRKKTKVLHSPLQVTQDLKGGATHVAILNTKA